MSKALKILSRPKGNAEEYGRWAVNPYKGCSHSCLYCYLKKGVWANGLGGDTAQLKTDVVNDEHAYHLAMAEIIANRDEIIRDGGLFMTFTSDPCAPETRDLFYRIAKESVCMDIPCTMLTKVSGIERFISEIARGLDYEYTHAGNIAIGWTLTGHDELEPGASTNAERILTIKNLKEKYVCGGAIRLWASIEPVIDFPSSLDMIYQALNAGCQHFKIGLLTNNTSVVRKPFEFGEHKFDAYKVKDCLHFIEDVMRMTDGKATVYWKQSVRDLLGTDFESKIDEYPHSVGKDWSMFTSGVR